MVSSIFRSPTLSNGTFSSPAMGKPGQKLDTKNDWKHDGDFVVAGGKTMPADTPLEQLEAFVPDNGAEIRGDVVMVNGIMTDVALQSADLQAMANKGYRVVGVHNATKGLLADLGQCLADKLNIHPFENRAITTTNRVVADAVEKGLTFNLVGHSQGALIVSDGISPVSRRLTSNGLSSSEVRSAFSKMPVTTLGGASATFPEGPAYSHHYNRADLVPMATGRPLAHALSADSNETMVGFTEKRQAGELPPWSNGISNRFARWVEETTHGVREIYLPHVSEGFLAAAG